MRLLLTCIITSMLLLACGHSEERTVLPRFDRLTTADGLSDDHVQHLLRLDNGRMVITSPLCINLYDDGQVEQFPVEPHELYSIPNYTGAYHVYADSEDGLWVKEWGKVWRMDLNTGSYTDLSQYPMRDVFVDSRHELWIVGDSTLSDEAGRHFAIPQLPLMPPADWDRTDMDSAWLHPVLQDLDADSLHLYLFFSNGTLVCYDRSSTDVAYMSAPYGEADVRQYDLTSLVVRSEADSVFYQLRCGRNRNIFLAFDPSAQTWRTVFETTKGPFHSLSVTPDAQLALLGCPQGVWEINLSTGEMDLHPELFTTDGDTLRTGINGIVYDRDGGLWMATYADGVLHAPQLHASRAYYIYYVALVLGIAALVVALLFALYARRMNRREHRLMERLHQLVLESATLREPTNEAEAAEQKVILPASAAGVQTAGETPDTIQPQGDGDTETKVAVDEQFIQQCAALVEKNLNTPGYGVEQLAADLCMERTGLYKKLTAQLDQTPTLFMRSIRMERAARLLREGRLSVTDIAEQCGFQSSSYFSRLFQQTYGVRPSEYK